MAESKEKKRSRDWVRNILDSFLAVFLFAITPYFPFLCYVSSILTAKVLLKSKSPFYFLFTSVFSIAAACILFGHIYLVLTYFILTYSFAILLAILLGTGRSFHSTTFITAAGSAALTFSFFIFIIYAIGGSLSFNGLENLFGDLWRSFAGGLRSYPQSVAGPENLERYKTAVENVISYVKSMMPFVPSMVVGASFVFSAAGIVYLKRTVPGLDLKKIGRFSGFKPERITGILGMLSFAAGLFVTDESLSIAFNSMNYIFLGYFTVACFSYISFIMTCRGLTPQKRNNIYAIAISVTVMFPFLAYIAGMAEALAQSRNKLETSIKKVTESGDSLDIKELLEQLRKKEDEIKKNAEESELKWYERESYKKMFPDENGKDAAQSDKEDSSDQTNNKNGGNSQ